MLKKKSELLAEFEEARGKKRQKTMGVHDLVKSIHSAPATREWVTLESRPLRPLVTGDADKREAVVHLLLSIPGKIAGDEALLPPWAYMAWKWPSCRLISMIDIRDMIIKTAQTLDNNHVCTKEFCDDIEKALEKKTDPPLPPEPVQTIFKMVFDQSPGCQAYNKRSTGETESSAPYGAPASGPIPGKKAPGGAALKRPPADDLHSELSTCLYGAKDLILECGQESLLAEWRRLHVRMNEPHFSVAVVGEFSRGKSTLINRMLNTDLLPVGVVPTTAMITRALYGPKPKMWRIYTDGKKEKLPLNSESWKELLADGSGVDPKGFIQLEIENEWLKKTGVHIIDTPGAGDLTGDRAALTADTIASCDATLAAISATMALSLTEKAFVDQHVFSRKTPRVAVVLTRLDEVAKAERASVVSYFKQKVAKWAPGVEICCAHAAPVLPEGSGIECAGPESILKMLSSWAENNHHFRLRGLQILSQLREIVALLRTSLTTWINASKLSREERRRFLKTGELQLDRNRLDWEDLRLALKNKEGDVISWFGNAVLEKKTAIVEKYRYDLGRAQNPKTWWEKDFPYRIRLEMASVARGIERSLKNRMERDAMWLEEEAQKMFSWEMKLDHMDASVRVSNYNVEFEGELIKDLNDLKFYSRVGVGVGSVLGYILFGPLGIVASVGGGILSEKMLSKTVENQKGELSGKIEIAIDEMFQNAIRITRERLGKIYKTIFERLREQESVWFETHHQALLKETGEDGNEIEIKQEQIKRADELLLKLQTAYKEVRNGIR